MTAAAALICPGVAVQLGVGFSGSVSERDPPRNNIEGAYTGLQGYMSTHATEDSPRGVPIGARMSVRPPIYIYKNVQKPNLKGGAWWFLGTKYHSEGSQFLPNPLLSATAYPNLSHRTINLQGQRTAQELRPDSATHPQRNRQPITLD